MSLGASVLCYSGMMLKKSLIHYASGCLLAGWIVPLFGYSPPLSGAASGYQSGSVAPAWVYDRSLLDFNLKNMLATDAPHLLPHADFLSHWCGYYSINPKVLLALAEMQSHLISGGVVSDRPFADLVPVDGFRNQIKAMLQQLYPLVHNRLKLNGAQILVRLFHQTDVKQSELNAEHFQAVYSALFPAQSRRMSSRTKDAASTTPPADMMELPWQLKRSWFFNGVHTWTGSREGVMSSIDFTRSWSLRWGDDTSPDLVTAAHAGTVTVFSSCFVRITAKNGWATHYYHMDDLRVVSGDEVQAGQVLGVYANEKERALCQGGSSSGPHVHFALLKDGGYHALSGTRLSGYRIRSGRYSYDSNPSFMWIEKAAHLYYAYQDTLYKEPAVTCTTQQAAEISISNVIYSNLEASVVCSNTKISAGPEVVVDTGAMVQYRAPQVSLLPGFQVVAGGHFVAAVDF